jgi:hypothetical protein
MDGPSVIRGVLESAHAAVARWVQFRRERMPNKTALLPSEQTRVDLLELDELMRQLHVALEAFYEQIEEERLLPTRKN